MPDYALARVAAAKIPPSGTATSACARVVSLHFPPHTHRSRPPPPAKKHPPSGTATVARARRRLFKRRGRTGIAASAEDTRVAIHRGQPGGRQVDTRTPPHANAPCPPAAQIVLGETGETHAEERGWKQNAPSVLPSRLRTSDSRDIPPSPLPRAASVAEPQLVQHHDYLRGSVSARSSVPGFRGCSEKEERGTKMRGDPASARYGRHAPHPYTGTPVEQAVQTRATPSQRSSNSRLHCTALLRRKACHRPEGLAIDRAPGPSLPRRIGDKLALHTWHKHAPVT
ncbi:hypothetical protein B0H17DRAFT_1330706 [Mycena rosella]|uniref:Uncharacterized protein n=1 Tax=Mycena rosella TaxID=1033263 RepID=A0AAD7GIP8_MYCRO|nr:hypothetical protein B0H17DRAFT_1330706 [Mycena rosella]